MEPHHKIHPSSANREKLTEHYKNKIAILALQEMHMDKEMTNQVREIFSKNLDIITSEDLTSP